MNLQGFSMGELAQKHLEKMSQDVAKAEKSEATTSAVAYVKVEEKPELKFVVYLKVLGKAVRDIAKETGFSELYVRNVLAQPWAREQERQLLATCDPATFIPMMLSNAAASSIYTLIEIRDNPKSAETARLKAADSLLDRYIGKAVQQIKMETPRKETDDVAELDRELEQLRARERDLYGRPKLREVTTANLEITDSTTTAA